MAFRLGIIGPNDLVEQSFMLSKDYTSIEVTKLPYCNENQTLDIVQTYDSKVDGFLFTGFLPYYKTKENMTTKKQLFYYPILGACLYRILFTMKVHHDIDVARISVDTISQREVQEIYDELGIGTEKLFVNEKSLMEFSRDEYVDFHSSLYLSDSTTGAITAINSVYEKLKNQGIPVFRITPTLFTMRETFRYIGAAAEAYNADNNNIIIQIIGIQNYNTRGGTLSNIEIRQKKLQLYHELLDYAKEHQASVFPLEEERFIILITKGIFKEYTNFYEDIPIIYDINTKLSMSVIMGIGMGRSALEAEENAASAFTLAQKKNGNGAYIINQDKKVIGPIGGKDRIIFELKSEDTDLLRLTEKTGLSISTLTQIQGVLCNLSRDTLTATELQEALGVTLRTANRIMNKLTTAGVASIVGIEQPVYRGRPRQVYRIKF